MKARPSPDQHQKPSNFKPSSQLVGFISALEPMIRLLFSYFLANFAHSKKKDNMNIFFFIYKLLHETKTVLVRPMPKTDTNSSTNNNKSEKSPNQHKKEGKKTSCDQTRVSTALLGWLYLFQCIVSL